MLPGSNSQQAANQRRVDNEPTPLTSNNEVPKSKDEQMQALVQEYSNRMTTSAGANTSYAPKDLERIGESQGRAV